MSVAHAAPRPLRAVLFDAFPIFDPRPIAAEAERLFPGRGAELMLVWRTRQFEYAWLRQLSGSYADFAVTTNDSLIYALRALGLTLDSAKRDALVDLYAHLRPWPDVRASLTALRAAGLRLAILSNLSPAMLQNGVGESNLSAFFEHVLSTDRIQRYKPDPAAYALGTDALGLPRDEILFAAFAGWDAAGAKRFGYPTYWINRTNAPLEELGVQPDRTGSDLAGLVAFATRHRS
ncbi:haloacid dehalogenase [Rhodospirillales bacterium TMPK1]|uniref:(S)-2-haloacid dehalogenase n=2 Tax=Roseiterribacter gracilis TaxID=2812848 RepID=A0A8S8XDE5_9PROT|nr:haloacid dehalogenase [Rhodospirillales bacterium TMPK1]